MARIPNQEPIDEVFVQGERFFKWGDSNSAGSSRDQTVNLYVDPDGHILYWRKKELYDESNASFIYIEDIVDVRRGEFADISQLQLQSDIVSFVVADIVNLVMTVVTNKDCVHPEFYTFLHKSSEAKVVEWTEFLFNLSQKRRREYHGQLYYVEKLLAPLRYAQLEANVHAKKIAEVLAPGPGAIAEKEQIEKTLLQLPAFTKKKKVPKALFDKKLVYEVTLAITERSDIAEIFCEISKNEPLRMTRQRFLKFINSKQRDSRRNDLLFPEATVAEVDNPKNSVECESQIEQLERELAHLCDDIVDKGVTIGGFSRYLLSDASADLDTTDFRLSTQDLHQPLSHYYISCSHNTYLTGAQINQAKYFSQIQHDRTVVEVEVYRQVLLSGCRCVELDCWDGSDGEPIITHGPMDITLLNSVPFVDVVKAIAESAFKSSPLPILLSIENHCCPTQQAKMARHFIEIFGDALLREPLPEHPLEEGVLLPSPHQLRGKILIKAKKLPPRTLGAHAQSTDSQGSSSITEAVDLSLLSTLLADAYTKSRSNSTYSFLEKTESQNSFELPVGPSAPPENPNKKAFKGMVDEAPEQERVKRYIHKTENDMMDRLSQERERRMAAAHNDTSRKLSTFSEMQLNAQIKPLKESSKLSRELSDLVNYLQAKKSSEIKLDEPEDRRFYVMHSFSEDNMSKFVADEQKAIALCRHFVRQLGRVYPSGMRYASSNYNPIFCWMIGCQMAALNYQTNGLAMQINDTLFAANGGSGYVLKPKCMRDLTAKTSPYADFLPNIIADTLEITVISGQFLSTLTPNRSSPLSTYVIVDLYDLPLDTVLKFSSDQCVQVRNKYKTKIARRNGLNPIYSNPSDSSEKPFRFEKITKPEGAFVHFRLMDADTDQELAQRLLPVDKLQPGYRHVILRTAANRPAGPASIFVYINIHLFVLKTQKGLYKALMDPVAATQKMEQVTNDFLDPMARVFGRNAEHDSDDAVSSGDEAEIPAINSQPRQSISFGVPKKEGVAERLQNGLNRLLRRKRRPGENENK